MLPGDRIISVGSLDPCEHSPRQRLKGSARDNSSRRWLARILCAVKSPGPRGCMMRATLTFQVVRSYFAVYSPTVYCCASFPSHARRFWRRPSPELRTSDLLSSAVLTLTLLSFRVPGLTCTPRFTSFRIYTETHQWQRFVWPGFVLPCRWQRHLYVNSRLLTATCPKLPFPRYMVAFLLRTLLYLNSLLIHIFPIGLSIAEFLLCFPWN